MSSLHALSIKNIFYGKMDLRFFYFDVMRWSFRNFWYTNNIKLVNCNIIEKYFDILVSIYAVCAVWHHSYNLKNMKLPMEECYLQKVTLFHGTRRTGEHCYGRRRSLQKMRIFADIKINGRLPQGEISLNGFQWFTVIVFPYKKCDITASN